ncbi:MAG: PEP-CTERM sorting domain-containing protein [Candidatus Brocadiaceae bacterium]|nr:PEP-CTERM sorting domain-containing protein [Candidatus Brocadiaceae bacterium]
MNKTKSALIFIIGTLFTSSAFASLITVEYSVNFTSYSNNAGSLANPPAYDTAAVQDTYLNPVNYSIKVLYDTNRDGIGTKSSDASVDIFGTWAEIIDTNILLPTDYSPYIYNFVDQKTASRGRITYIETSLAGSINLGFYDFESIEDLTVGAASNNYVRLTNWMPGEYADANDPSEYNHAYNMYEGTATVLSIAKVPEPGTLTIFCVGLFGLFCRRFKTVPGLVLAWK